MSIVGRIWDGKTIRVVEDLAAIEAAVADEHTIMWVDTDEHGGPAEVFLRERLRLHPLTVEDIFSVRNTPKVEDYEHSVYVVMHGVRGGDGNGDGVDDEFATIELDLVIGDRWLFTHHDTPLAAVDEVVQELSRNPRLLARGPAWVAHALVDQLTDAYLPVVDRYEEAIDEIERTVVEAARPELLSRLFTMKRSLQRLRRVSAYQRDILLRLSRNEFTVIPESVLPFFRDVYDHFVRIADLADSYREMVTVSLEIYMSVVANRTNDIMKVLALISTLMLPLSFIAGVYGMNFHNMPEIPWRYGYPMALGLMATVAAGMLWMFRRRRWL